jgi:hypothetical protein
MAMLKKLITLASLAVSLSSAAWIKPAGALAQTSRNERFTVGILRQDGVVAPFAQYANRKWTNPWHSRQPGDQADEPDTIADRPKPWFQALVKPSSKWYLPTPSGELTAIKTSKIVQVCSHCQQVWGLLSDYPNPRQPEKNDCVRNVSAALSEKKRARAMETITNSSPDWKQMLTFLGPEFKRTEDVGISRIVSRQYSAQLPSAKERARVPLSLLSLYRSEPGDDGRLLFYFEASKEYSKPREANDAGCNNVSLLGGWATRNPQGKLILLDSQFSPTDCDMKEGGLALPFAILRLDGKTFAIMEEDSYEGEVYTILEIQKNRVRRVLETYAGSC